MGDSHISYKIFLREDLNSSTISCTSSTSTPNSIITIQDAMTLSADSTLCEVISKIDSSTINILNKSIDNHNNLSSPQPPPTTTTTPQEYSLFHNTMNTNKKKKDATIHYSLYDCTTYPPKEITSLVHKYTSPVGPNSITLQKLDWFPSAKLIICQADDTEAIQSILNSDIHLLDEFEYNSKNTTASMEKAKSKGKKSVSVVKLTGELGKAVATSTSLNSSVQSLSSINQPLPSQILKVVERRFDNPNEIDNVHQTTIISNNNNKASSSSSSKYRSEHARRKLLDLQLEKLDERMKNKKSNKNKKVSDQVKNMLIKSRAEGNKRLRQEDRFYLEVILWDESSGGSCCSSSTSSSGKQKNDHQDDGQSVVSSTHMFFSKVATIGKVVAVKSGCIAKSRDKGAELLILTTEGEHSVYRRLPPTMPLHEAASKGYIGNFGRVIIRLFKGETDSITSSYSQCITDK